MSNWREGKSNRGSGPKRSAPKPSQPESSAPQQPKPKGWRKRSAQTAAKAGDQERHVWSDQSGDPTSASRAFHRFKVVAAAIVLLGLVAWLVWSLRPQERTSIVFVAPGFTQPNRIWQSNSGLTSAETNMQLFANGGKLKPVHDKDGVFLTPGSSSEWAAFFNSNKAGPSGPARNTLVFFLAASGVVGNDGQPYLLKSQAARPLNNSAGRVKITELFDELVSKVPKRRGRRTQILVLLDSTRVEPISSLAWMYDHFPSELQRVYQEGEYAQKGLFVICSHRDGQRSWLAHELGGSIFAYFAARGMTGAANAQNDRFVSLEELREYLEREVSEYAWSRRSVRQRPILLPKELTDDISLVIAGDSPTGPRPSATLGGVIAQRQDQLDAKWKTYFDLADTGAWSSWPIERGIVEAQLIRLEQLLITDNGDEFDSLLKDVAFPSRRRVLQLPDVSLAIYRLNHPSTADPTLAQLWDDYKKQFDLANSETEPAAEPAPTEDSAGGDGSPQEPADPKKRLAEISEQLPHLQATRGWDMHRLVWQKLLAIEPGPQRSDLEQAALFLAFDAASPVGTTALPPGIGVLPLETKFIQLLLDNVQWPQNDDDDEQIRQAIGSALRCRDISEETTLEICRNYPSAIRFIKDDFDELESRRRRAEDQLFAQDSGASRREYRLILGLSPNAGATSSISEYEDIRRRAQAIEEAVTIYRQALRATPYLTALQMRRLLVWQDQKIGQFNDNASGLVQATVELAAVLNASELDASRVQNLSQVADRCRKVMSEFDLRPIGTEATRKHAIDFSFVLNCPLINATERRAWRRALLQSIADSLTEGSGPVVGPSSDEGLIGYAAVQDATQRLQNARLKDLPRVGNEAVSFLDQVTANSDWTSVNPNAIAKLAELDQLVGAKPESLLQRVNAAFQADSQIRMIAPHLGELGAFLDNVKDNYVHLFDVSREYEELLEVQQLLWLAERARNDFWGSGVTAYWPTISQAHLSRIAPEYSDLSDVSAAKHTNQTIQNWWNGLQVTSQVADSFNRFNARVQAPSEWRNLTAVIGDGIARVVMDDTAQPSAPRPLTFWLADQSQSAFAQPLVLDPSAETQLPLALNILQPVSKPPYLRLVFRGHAKGRTLRPPDIGEAPPTVIPTPTLLTAKPRGAPSVTVHGQGTAVANALFLLDVSRSMEEAGLAGEDQRNNAIGPNRLKIASGRLAGVLTRLQQSGSFQTGLMLFGHGFRFNSSDRTFTKKTLVRDDQNNPRFLETTIPLSELGSFAQQGQQYLADTEVVFPLAPLTTHYGQMIAFLESDELRPYGATPLYAAIKRGIEHIRSQRTTSNERVKSQIIVLSDGFDNIGSEYEHNSLNELRQAMANNPNIAVNIILMDMDAIAGDAAFEEIKSLTDDSGGIVASVNRATDLTDKLLEIIKIHKFQVSPISGGPRGDSLELRSEWRLPDTEFKPGAYRVTVDGIEESKTLELRGGERIEYDIVSNRLQLRADAPLPAGVEEKEIRNTGYKASLIHSDALQQSIQFSFRLRDLRGGLTVPPARACLIATPTDQQPGTGQSLVVQDFNVRYEGHVPIIEFAGIPNQAYHLQLYVSRDPSDSESISLQSGSIRYPRRPGPEDRIYEIQWQWGPAGTERRTLQVAVKALQPVDGAIAEELRRLLVFCPEFEPILEQNPPRQPGDPRFAVQRTFFSDNHRVLHEFQFGSGLTANEQVRLVADQLSEVFGSSAEATTFRYPPQSR